MYDLRCPRCDKLLGKTTNERTAPLVQLWCRRCKLSVIPIPSQQSQRSEKG